MKDKNEGYLKTYTPKTTSSTTKINKNTSNDLVIDRKIITLIIIGAILLFLIGVAMGAGVYALIDDDEIIDVASTTDETAETQIETVTTVEAMEEVPAIQDGTIITYEYYYNKDEHTKIDSFEAPYYMIGMTEEEIIAQFPDYELKSFTNEEVVLYKEFDEAYYNTYTISIYGDDLVLYYGDEKDDSNIIQTVKVSTSALPEEELAKLEEGITVYGEEELNKLLESYTS